MTLYRQLFIGISLLFFVLLAGVQAIYLANSRSQLQAQLSSQAQDTATALALRLAVLGSLSDQLLVETTVNPVFDRGYFREISVVSVDGRVVVRKVLPPAQGDVPAWFTALLPIETHTCNFVKQSVKCQVRCQARRTCGHKNDQRACVFHPRPGKA